MVRVKCNFLVLVAVLMGLFARDLLELLVEIGHRLEPARKADVINVHLVFLEEFTCILDAYFFEEV